MSRHRASDVRPGAAHIGGGWYARRGTDGSVMLRCPEGDTVTLTAREWVAAVAALTAGGTSDAAIRDATLLHAR